MNSLLSATISLSLLSEITSLGGTASDVYDLWKIFPLIHAARTGNAPKCNHPLRNHGNWSEGGASGLNRLLAQMIGSARG